MAFYGIILLNDLLGQGKKLCLLLNEFPDHDHLISTITIQRDILNPIWDIFGGGVQQ